MRILIVEDDLALADGLRSGLGLHGFTGDAVHTLGDADLAARDHPYEAIILDISLPDGSGLDLLRQWRNSGVTTPILLLTAYDATRDRITGLDAGADDYLGKPFDLDELLARLRAMVRRSTGQVTPIITLGDLEICESHREVRQNGTPVALSRREFALLHALASRPGHVLSRGQLEERLYGWQEEVASNAVEVHVHNLRAKLGRDVIETVRGAGYRVATT